MNGCFDSVHSAFLLLAMKRFKKIMKPARRIVFALMLSVCIIMGVPLAPPKRKETFDIEVKAETADKKGDAKTTAAFRADD
jgi:uncharacterized membrane protein